MGLLTELFRRSKGVLQSRHPVYRVAALGPHAQELIRGHENAPSGMGKGTPFDYMAQHNARIIGIGKTFQVMTQTHHVESLLGSDWPAPQVLSAQYSRYPGRQTGRNRNGDRGTPATMDLQYLEVAGDNVERKPEGMAFS